MQIGYRHIIFCMLLVVAIQGRPACADGPVAVLLSREIAPYAAMLEAFEQEMGTRPVVRFFFDDRGRTYSLEARSTLLDPAAYGALVAVGPEALRYLHARVGDTPLLFGMVLRPEQAVASPLPPLCGIDLEIPVAVQLVHIRQQLPHVQTLGILYDPQNNQTWFDQAQIHAASLGFSVTPLHVSRSRDGLEVVGGFDHVDAALFIPDQSIVSPAVIQHVIKESLQQRVPLVGFNQFFLDSGTAFSFIVDYRQIGRQVAELVTNSAAGNCTQISPPPFALRTNSAVLKLLNLTPGGGKP